MCSVAYASIIGEVVEEYVAGRKLFTALQVSRAVQTKAQAAGHPFEPHRNLRDTIHGEMSNYIGSDYRKTRVEIPNVGEAILFYPQECDTPKETYLDSLSVDPVPAATGSMPPVQAPDPGLQNILQSLANAGGGTVTATALTGQVLGQAAPHQALKRNSPGQKTNRVADDRGTVSVPVDLVKEIGLNARATAYVYRMEEAGENKLVVCREAYQPGGSRTSIGLPELNFLTEYTVDDYCAIRITHSQLVISGLTNAAPGVDSFDFSINNGTIVMCRHS